MNVLKDIAMRTDGDIYIGVVGPVRTGKSTFIKRFMDLMVLPNVTNMYEKQRITDELPQSAEGKTIMTTEPKFVPDKAMQIDLGDNTGAKIKMIDCVGYIVPESLGYMEDGESRMVKTPWSEENIPFAEAAEIGTEKVISEHSTIGLVITTDGSVVDIPRSSYVPAEERVINELKALNKPFVVLVNSKYPKSTSAANLCDELSAKYNVPVMCTDCTQIEESEITEILKSVLYEFPVSEISFKLPGWIKSLGNDNEIKKKIMESVCDFCKKVYKVRDVKQNAGIMNECEYVSASGIYDMTPAHGSATVSLNIDENLFYNVLSESTGMKIDSDYELMRVIRELSEAKSKYDKLEYALNEVKEKGYGIVSPDMTELTLEEPEIIRQGNKYGVCLRASAPSIHIMCNKPKSLEAA